MSDTNSVGLSIGIYKNGKYYTYNYGEIEKGTNILPSSKSFYELGSTTKTFVGILLAKAVIEKKVKLSDDIRKYLKGNYPNLEYNGNPIHLVNLANHTSGMPNEIVKRPDSFYQLTPLEQINIYEKYTSKDFENDLHSVVIGEVPGTKYNYSGVGINTLILILQNIYSKSFEQMVKEYFGNQFDMTNTKKTLSQNEIKRTVTGYDERGSKVPYLSKNTAELGPGLLSTVEDMLKYIKYNIQEKNKALSLSHKKTFKIADDFDIGLSWMMAKNLKDDDFIFHTGKGFGGMSACTFYPKWKTGFILLANEKYSQKRLSALERNLSTALNEK